MRVLETVSQSCPGSLCTAQLDTVILLPHAPKLLGHQALLSLAQKSSGQCEDSVYKCLSLWVCIVISHTRCIWKLCPYYTFPVIISNFSFPCYFHSNYKYHIVYLIYQRDFLCFHHSKYWSIHKALYRFPISMFRGFMVSWFKSIYKTYSKTLQYLNNKNSVSWKVQ